MHGHKYVCEDQKLNIKLGKRTPKRIKRVQDVCWCRSATVSSGKMCFQLEFRQSLLFGVHHHLVEYSLEQNQKAEQKQRQNFHKKTPFVTIKSLLFFAILIRISIKQHYKMLQISSVYQLQTKQVNFGQRMAKIRVYHASTPKVSMNAVIIRPFSISNFDHLNAFQDSTFRSFSNMANLPVIDAICSELVHQFLFPVVPDADEQPSTGLGSIPLHELEILNLVFYFDQAFINGQFVDDQLNVGFLGLSQIVRMAEDAEASDISAGACLILTKKTCSDKAQSGHLFFSAIEGLNKFRLACLFQDFFSFFLAGFEPLHGVDGEASSKRFCEDDGIAWLCVVGHDEFLIFDDGNGTAAHHRPLIIDCLSASHLRSCLLRGIGEALDHQSGRHVFLQIIHFGGDSQNHQDFLDVGDAHGVEVGNCVAECDAAEHVGRLHQWVEKVESGDESVGRDFDSRHVWGLNSDRLGQFGQV